MLASWLLFPAVALATPLPLLGPSGTLWLGPATPGGGETALVVVVDPWTGAPFVEERSGRRVATWEGGRWQIDGEPLRLDAPKAAGPEGEAPDAGLLRGGRLRTLVDPQGGVDRFRYDDAGRLLSVDRPDGSRIGFTYDPEGRVVGIQGPGPARWSFRWGSTLVAQDGLGALHRISRAEDPDGGIEIVVEDGLGHRVESRWAPDVVGHLHPVAWTDPRGATTRIAWGAALVEVEGPSGAHSRLELDEAGRVVGLAGAGEGEWRWTRDAQGRLRSLTDPAGRRTAWERDAAGRVVAIDRGGGISRFERSTSGDLQKIVSPSGGSTSLGWDQAGGLVRIVDAVGGELRMVRAGRDALLSVVGRGGEAWSFATDLFGRTDRLVDPDRRVIALSRDAAGRLTGIEDSLWGRVRLDRRLDGQLVRVVDPEGRATGLVRDPAGRLRSVIRGDGQVIELERDAAGDLREVLSSGGRIQIDRDAAGLPRSADGVTWGRDAAGRIRRLTDGGVELRFDRDPAGRISRIRGPGGWQLAISRDRAGFVVGWRGTDGEIELSRDPAGRPSVERGGPESVQLQRDPRGLVEVATAGEARWRWLRDATGRVLRVVGPGSATLGVERDLLGRPRLLRFPDGSLQRLGWAGALLSSELMDAAGQLLDATRWALRADGRPEWREEEGSGRRTWRYDPADFLVAIEEEAGGAWSWTQGEVTGPGGATLLLDESGHLAEANPPMGPAAWRAGSRTIAIERDGVGRMSWIRGELDQTALHYDPIGRLEEIEVRGLGSWRLAWDARGRLARVEAPDGSLVRPLWTPTDRATPGKGGLLLTRAALDPAGPLLARGSTEQIRVGGPGGWAVSERDGAVEILVRDPWGDPTRVLGEGGARLATSPGGLPELGVAGMAGAAGSWQVFPGGPLIVGSRAFDPLSGEPIDGDLGLPWSPAGIRTERRRTRLDPELWAPDSPWHDPVALLFALGAIPSFEGEDEAWSPGKAPDPAVGWLAASLDDARPPLGPAPWDLPLALDPMSQRWLAAAMGEGREPDLNLLAASLLDEDLAVRPLPGLRLPGLEPWFLALEEMDR